MSKTIEEILAPKPEARPRLYAYSIDDKAHTVLAKCWRRRPGESQRDSSTQPRVARSASPARSSQPWAEGLNPFGIERPRAVKQRVAEQR